MAETDAFCAKILEFERNLFLDLVVALLARIVPPGVRGVLGVRPIRVPEYRLDKVSFTLALEDRYNNLIQ